jgi:hypothetical protein
MAAKRRTRTPQERMEHLHKALSKLVILAEAAAELHVAASLTAAAIAELLEEMEALSLR